MSEVPEVIIIGVSGSGKSQVATALGNLLSRPVMDNVRIVEAREKTSVSRLMTDDPEGALESLSAAALELMQVGGPGSGAVVSLSPSAILSDGVREALTRAREAGSKVVALRAPLEALVKRNGLDAPQPTPLGTPRAWFRKQISQLEGAYSPVADLWCDTGTTDSTINARLIVDALGLKGSPPRETD